MHLRLMPIVCVRTRKVSMSEKSKKLLERLKDITREPEKKVLPSTNRFYLDNGIRTLPKIYDKARKHKDEDGEEFVWIDRLYGGIFESKLVERDGSAYKGKIYKKRRLVTSQVMTANSTTSFYSRCYTTADGRWFDNTGFPIEAPSNLEPEPVKTKEEIEQEKRIKAEKAKAKEAEILAKLK
jgi:hypothetical protein